MANDKIPYKKKLLLLRPEEKARQWRLSYPNSSTSRFLKY
jgi:hypothetical protein